MKASKQTIVRDISWLAFNARVLQEAKDSSNHVFDRLHFLGIFSNNLDEFFRVRVATLNKMTRLGKTGKMHLEANPEKILAEIQDIVIAQQTAFDQVYTDIIKELGKKNIFIKNEHQLSKLQKTFVRDYFDEHIHSQIIPLMIESIAYMPLLKDKSIYLACVLSNNTKHKLQRYALIEIPTKVLPRFVILPSEKKEKNIILLEDIIKFNLPHLFAPFGYNHIKAHIFKVTRDAELELDNDINTNLITEIEKGLKNRKKGRTTRFVYDREMDETLLNYLVKRLGLTKKDNILPGGRIHNFKDYMNFPADVFNDLEQRPKPFVHPLLEQPCRIMDVIQERDVLLHFPYHSFDSIIDLLREAAIDPYVQTIKITCYRLADDSKLINALLNAVRNGKEVTVMLELRARFDEEANLLWKKRLEEEGVKVLLGFPDMKVHAKLCVIKKKEASITKQYAFISTGNFNEKTAQYYGDHCLLTTNKEIIADINTIFSFLDAQHPKIERLENCKVLPVAPLNMRKFFVQQMNKEIKTGTKKQASMIIKLNNLVDKELIAKIYEATKAGVTVQLIIRGICCAYTDKNNQTGTIEAISIIDRYLEHARVFVFNNGKKPNVYISSGDWMIRNLDYRLETACPIYDLRLQNELIDILGIQLAENIKGRTLDNEQRNEYVIRKKGQPEVRAQKAIYQYLKNKKY